ncbi:hypothetical protein P4H61_24745 [Paenibacillus peoriae]|uniref:hypothetical protein n=1 Tax=Paenibacillus peoriae TaxID=59893 RepID=UPI00026C5C76|nr:hypothetical protein [Paenibacillus peoriae]MEC0184687.1 hypothetical protein [Paenibacillus peoriae]
MAGTIVGLFSLTALFVGLFSGILTDRTNKKYVMLVKTVKQDISSKHSEVAKKNISFKDIIAVRILPLSLIGGLFSMGNRLVSSFLVLLGEERGIKGVGMYFTMNALILLIMRPLSGRLYDKKGLSIILYPALFSSSIESLYWVMPMSFGWSFWRQLLKRLDRERHSRHYRLSPSANLASIKVV